MMDEVSGDVKALSALRVVNECSKSMESILVNPYAHPTKLEIIYNLCKSGTQDLANQSIVFVEKK